MKYTAVQSRQKSLLETSYKNNEAKITNNINQVFTERVTIGVPNLLFKTRSCCVNPCFNPLQPTGINYGSLSQLQLHTLLRGSIRRLSHECMLVCAELHYKIKPKIKQRKRRR